ncbi:MAG: T9SS type A sorting domain-containing protein, partial [Bacteroidota bacterium]
ENSVNNNFGNYHSSTITVRTLSDGDGSFATANDRTTKSWYLTIMKDATVIASGTDTLISVDSLAPGLYTVTQADSVGWEQLGKVIDGNATADSVNFTASINVQDGQVSEIIFVNKFVPDIYKFRTFKASSELTTKATKMTFLKATLGGGLKPGTEPNLSSVGENLFIRIGKAGATFLGIKQTDAAQAKLKGWIAYKKFSDLAKLYSAPHDGRAFPIDSLRVTGKKSKKLSKAIAASKKIYNNQIWEQGVMLNLNILASADSVTPKGFGSLLFDTTFTLIGRELKGLTLNQVKTYLDSLMTEYTVMGVDADVDYSNLGVFAQLLKRINESFYTTFAVGGENSKIDTAGVKLGAGQPSGKKNAYAVTLLGYKTVAEAGGGRLKKNTSARNEEYVLQPYGVSEVPSAFSLEQNYPNPFNPTTAISFQLSAVSNVTLKIYNVVGQEVATLINNESMDEGAHEVQFDASILSSGVYFYKLTTEEFTATKKMVLVK